MAGKTEQSENVQKDVKTEKKPFRLGKRKAAAFLLGASALIGVGTGEVPKAYTRGATVADAIDIESRIHAGLEGEKEVSFFQRALNKVKDVTYVPIGAGIAEAISEVRDGIDQPDWSIRTFAMPFNIVAAGAGSLQTAIFGRTADERSTRELSFNFQKNFDKDVASYSRTLAFHHRRPAPTAP